MAQAELDGVVITEHDAFWSAGELAELRKANPAVRIYAGIEVSATDGHVIAIGTSGLLAWRKDETVESIARRVGLLGGCAIWVHPFQSPVRWLQPARTVHAVEIHSTITFGRRSQEATQLAADLAVHCVAGSDAHALDHLGVAGVEVDDLPVDEIELARLIRRGNARPFRRGSESRLVTGKV